MATREVSLNVTEFKAKCLGLFKDLERGRVGRITVTRRGSPVATVQRSQPLSKDASLDDIFADMRGLIAVAPGVDLTAPLDVPDPEDPFIGKAKSRRGNAA